MKYFRMCRAKQVFNFIGIHILLYSIIRSSVVTLLYSIYEDKGLDYIISSNYESFFRFMVFINSVVVVSYLIIQLRGRKYWKAIFLCFVWTSIYTILLMFNVSNVYLTIIGYYGYIDCNYLSYGIFLPYIVLVIINFIDRDRIDLLVDNEEYMASMADVELVEKLLEKKLITENEFYDKMRQVYYKQCKKEFYKTEEYKLLSSSFKKGLMTKEDFHNKVDIILNSAVEKKINLL